MTKEKKQEYTLKITRANKSQMVEILYEILEEYLMDAKNSYDNNDKDGFHDYIIKATAVIKELNQSINWESDLARRFFSIYIYFQKELALADIYFDINRVEIIMRLVSKFKKTYEEVSKIDTSEPVMKNTETMYAGLTYGKESLVVHINGDRNRGYSV